MTADTARALAGDVRRPRALRLPPIHLDLGATLAGTFVILLVIAALRPAWLAPYDPYAVRAVDAFQAPSLAHVFGTDHVGRDLLSRIIEGTSQSLLIGIGATAIGVGGGLLLGLLSGLGPRPVDLVVGRLIEVLFVFPTVLIALALIAFLGAGIGPLIVAVGVGTIADNARLIRAQTLAVRNADYVAGARALGWNGAQRIVRVVIPNVIGPVFVIATIGIAQAILWASSLSFLGFGAQPPSAEWGAILADGRNYVQSAWWISVFPGLAITLSALSFTVLARRLRNRLEGR